MRITPRETKKLQEINLRKKNSPSFPTQNNRMSFHKTCFRKNRDIGNGEETFLGMQYTVLRVILAAESESGLIFSQLSTDFLEN